MHRILPLLFLSLLLGGCAAVHLGSGHTPPNGGRNLDAARADADCSERIWRDLGSPPTIRVECRDDAVFLRGTVSSDASRRAVVSFVRQRTGVNEVIDRLVVR